MRARIRTVEPADRDAALEAERHRKMAVSTHAYVRGSTLRFYEWLAASNRSALLEGPQVWICGDCHVGNLGPIASADGALANQVRDLDQTVIGNPAHDIIRLALSLAMAARSSDLPGVTTAHMIERVVHGSEAAFRSDARRETLDTESAMPRTVRRVMRDAAGRSWRHLADERIEGNGPVIPLGKRFWPLTREERGAIDALFAQDELRRLVTSLRSRADTAGVRVLDAAYWRKGCSSLGLLRVAVLVAVGIGRAERHCLLDVKQAVAAAAPCSADAVMPEDDAERVVAGARVLSPFLGRRMMAARLLDKPVFVRELLPQDLKLEVEHLSVQEAMEVAEFLAHVVGRGHARQMSEADRDQWVGELERNRSRSLDAPSWLWNSVVDLVATQGAYLEHCRRWALADAACRREPAVRTLVSRIPCETGTPALAFANRQSRLTVPRANLHGAEQYLAAMDGRRARWLSCRDAQATFAVSRFSASARITHVLFRQSPPIPCHG